MKTLLDTNVVLDVLLARKPHVTHATEIFRLIECSRMEGFLCATSITTINYLLRKALPAAHATEVTRTLLSLFGIAVVNRSVIECALKLRFADFEDAVLHEAARIAGMNAIITRNTRDFTRASLPVYDPAEFLALPQ